MNTNLFTKSEIKNNSFIDSISSYERGNSMSVMDTYGHSGSRPYVNNVRLHDQNFAFFTSTLGQLHKELVEPQYFVTYLRDIPVEYGGGFVEYVSYHSVNWSGLMNEMRGVQANNSNYLPRVNAGINQHRVNVYTYEVAYDMRFLELEKLKKLELQKSMEEIYQNAIVAGWDLFVQRVAYTGIEGRNGLFNHENVVPITIDNNVTQVNAHGGTAGLTDTQVVAIFNKIFSTYLQNSSNNFNLLPDTILVPTFVGADLTNRYNELYTSTLRKYISEHNLAVDESNGAVPRVEIESRAALNDLGTAQKGRIVAYKKDKSFVRMDIPYPIQHFITLPNIEKMSYTTVFVGQVSEIQLPYNQPGEFGVVTYWDFTK